MEWRWGWLWSILWNILVHAVTFNWTELGRDGDRFREWWRSLWSEIESRVNDLRSWAQGRISWLSGYAFGLYWQAISKIYDIRAAIESKVAGWVNSARSLAYSLRDQVRNLVWSLYWQARNFAQSIVNQVYAWTRPYVDNAINWLRGLYAWIQPYRDLITNWLVGARGAIDWLWHYAIGRLQAFLNDPIGFALGWLLTPIRNIVNFWQQYGPGLMTFVANELADLRTLWENGKRILKALVDNPEGFIFDLLAPMFLDWLEQLIADNW